MVDNYLIGEEEINELIDSLLLDDIYKRRKLLRELIDLFLQKGKDIMNYEVLKHCVLQYSNIRNAVNRTSEYDYDNSIVRLSRERLVEFVIDEYRKKLANDPLDVDDDYGDTDIIDYTQKGKKVRKLSKTY